MLPSLVIIIAAVFIVTVAMQLTMRWVAKLIGVDVETRLRFAQTIVEDHAVPEVWIHRYRLQIDAMRSQGRRQKDIDKVGQKALRHCLKQLDDVMFFFTRANVADTPDTRDAIVAELESERQRWLDGGWPVLFEPPPVRVADDGDEDDDQQSDR